MDVLDHEWRKSLVRAYFKLFSTVIWNGKGIQGLDNGKP